MTDGARVEVVSTSSVERAAGWHRRRFAPPAANGHLSVWAVVRLRWWSLGLQGVAVALVAGGLPSDGSVFVMGACVGIGVVSNLFAPRVDAPSGRVVGALALLDVVLLTGLLSQMGGPSNPFSVVYLSYVMLAAIATSPGWTWSAVALSSVGFGLLFFISVPLPPELGGHAGHGEGQPYAAHLQGMWVAHTITSAVIARFVGRLSDALNREQQTRAQTSRMLGLATMAAGAAHEIGNPLGTIRVAASELERDLSREGAAPETLRDLALIGQEVRRAHRVLEHMSIGAGELRGEGPVPTDLATLLDTTVAALGVGADRVKIRVRPSAETVRWPLQAASQALTQLIRNAIEVSPPTQLVDIDVEVVDGAVDIVIRDCGPGMNEETLSRIGEPFFTTRPGEGQGLGVFISRSLVEHLGGRIEIDSALGKGTVARVWLPQQVGV